MIITVEEMKGYLREDGTGEDNDIEDLIDAAEIYLKNAGCTLTVLDETGLNETVNKLAKLAVKQLVVHWFENREPTGKGDKLQFGLASIIAQLKYC